MAKKPESDEAPKIIDPAAAAEDADGEDVPPKETTRNQVLDDIQSTRKAQLRENGVELAGEEDDDPADPDAEADPADPDNPADPDAAGAAEEDTSAAEGEEDPDADPDAAPDAPDAPDVRMVTITVDGQERQVPESELIASFQKNAAADDRLRLANDILDEATARRDAPAAPAQPAEGEDETKDNNPLDAIDWKAAVDKLQFGSKEEGAQALRGLVEEISATNKDTGVPFDMEATQREITQRVNDGQEWQRALADFGDNYQDIIEDPQLQAMTARRANQIFTAVVEESVAAGRPQRPAYADVFRAAGDETRAWVKTVRGEGGGDNPGDNPQPNQRADGDVQLSKERTELKRTTSNIPKPRSVQKTKPTGDAKPKTAGQIRREGIEQIMKDREKVA